MRTRFLTGLGLLLGICCGIAAVVGPDARGSDEDREPRAIPRDGRFAGSFSGSASGRGRPPVTTSGTIEFVVRSGRIVLLQPVRGRGRVNSRGVFRADASDPDSPFHVAGRIRGSEASGRFTRSSRVTIRGTWSATR
jgi:hypothetical protein